MKEDVQDKQLTLQGGQPVCEFFHSHVLASVVEVNDHFKDKDTYYQFISFAYEYFFFTESLD